MKSHKGKVTTDHPMHKLYEAALDIVNRTMQAYDKAAVQRPTNFTIPVWMDGEPLMKITIETGTKTTAEYAIFKAQNKETK